MCLGKKLTPVPYNQKQFERKNMEIKKIVFIGIFASVYVALTALNPIGYGPIQFRVSEFMLILPFWDKNI